MQTQKTVHTNKHNSLYSNAKTHIHTWKWQCGRSNKNRIHTRKHNSQFGTWRHTFTLENGSAEGQRETEFKHVHIIHNFGTPLHLTNGSAEGQQRWFLIQGVVPQAWCLCMTATCCKEVGLSLHTHSGCTYFWGICTHVCMHRRVHMYAMCALMDVEYALVAHILTKFWDHAAVVRSHFSGERLSQYLLNTLEGKGVNVRPSYMLNKKVRQTPTVSFAYTSYPWVKYAPSYLPYDTVMYDHISHGMLLFGHISPWCWTISHRDVWPYFTVMFDQVGKDGTVQKVTEQTGIEGTTESYKKFMQLVCNMFTYNKNMYARVHENMHITCI